MKESQIEIQAIQAKLQALQMGRSAMRQPSDPPIDRSPSENMDWVEERFPQGRSVKPRQFSPRETHALLRQLHVSETATAPVTRLESHIEHINELAAAQEAALRELKVLTEAVDRTRLEFEPEAELPTCEFLAASVPLVERDAEGVFVVSTRAIDLDRVERDRSRAEREAASIAKTLRRRTSRRRRSLWDWLKPLLEVDQPVSRRQSAPPNLTLADAAIWIISAAIARIGLDLLLSAFPHLWLPVVALIVVPAAIAIYRTTFTPETGFAWGYRLFLVMIGMLLGGRFM